MRWPDCKYLKNSNPSSSGLEAQPTRQDQKLRPQGARQHLTNELASTQVRLGCVVRSIFGALMFTQTLGAASMPARITAPQH